MIDKELLKEFREDFKQAVLELEDKYGFVIDLEQIKYGTTSFEGTLKVTEGESHEAVYRKDFAAICSKYGFQESDFGKSFISSGKAYTIIGLMPNRKKYPVLVRQRDGSKRLFNNWYVLQQIRK